MEHDYLMEALRAIVSQEPPWNKDDLAEWANEFLYAFESDDDDAQDRWEVVRHRQDQEVGRLKPQVCPYLHDPALPALPDEPDGALHGIGFIYDEDRDDRVLVAIDQLKDNPGLVALAEHEGSLRIYTRSPIDLSSINVCGDEWVVEEFVPYRSWWTEVTDTFVRECVVQVLGELK